MKSFLGVVLWAVLYLVLMVQTPALGQVLTGPVRFPGSASGSEALITPLSEEERTWLKEHPVIRVAQDPGWPPVEFIDKRGVPAGISNDYLDLIQERLGINL